MLEVKKYFAIWCGPCRMLNPTFDKLKTEYGGVKFTQIDIDEQMNDAQQAGVMSVPTIVIEKDGVEVERFVGVQSDMAYRNAINEHLAS